MCRSGRERDSGERKSDGELVKSERMNVEEEGGCQWWEMKGWWGWGWMVCIYDIYEEKMWLRKLEEIRFKRNLEIFILMSGSG